MIRQTLGDFFDPVQGLLYRILVDRNDRDDGQVEIRGELLDIDLDAFAAGVIALGLNGGAYVAEIIRGGLQSVPRGQVEAAKAALAGRTRDVDLIEIGDAIYVFDGVEEPETYGAAPMIFDYPDPNWVPPTTTTTTTTGRAGHPSSS